MLANTRSRCALTLVSLLAVFPAISASAADSTPTKIAVFEFELQDDSAAGAAAQSDTAADLERMRAVTAEARRLLTQSGRYTVIDTAPADAQPVKMKTLHSCNGCDAGIALKLGADQSLVGLITRVAKTEYYASLQITDARTGKILGQQTAFFTGADDAWASGVRMLLRHGALADTR
jgi:hypothetical protein